MYGTATVTVYDDCDEPVPGALVSGTFTGDFNGVTASGATDRAGVAVLRTPAPAKKPTFNFILDPVVAP